MAVQGKVILAAAGPGDPDLITVRAVSFLAQADVILADRLVSGEIMERYAAAGAEIVYVGKQGRSNASTPQRVICELMVQYALQGKLVVRLKGGDVSIFSNILDELEALVNASVPYEIIPGVTSALGAAAYSGIPLTARGFSTGVRLLTYHQDIAIDQKEWSNLAFTSDTLVFYMSSHAYPRLATQLLAAGMDSKMPVAIIEQATTAGQRVHIATLAETGTQPLPTFASPTLIIIGRVVALQKEFNWFKADAPDRDHFHSIVERSTNVHQILSHDL